MWRLNNWPLNIQWITEEIKEKKKYPETDKIKSMTIQNLWDTEKTVLRGKTRAIQSYLRKQEKSQTNKLTFLLKYLEKEEQTKP